MHWRVYLQQRARRTERAVALAAALRRGEGPLEIFQSWRFADQPALRDLALAQLGEATLRPEPAVMAALPAPEDTLSPPGSDDGELSLGLHRRRLRQLGLTCEGDPLAWAIDELDFLGSEIARKEREAWIARPFPDQPEKDAASRTLWTQWFDGDLWSGRETWEHLFLGPCAAVFQGVLGVRHVPADVRDRVLDDLREGFFFQLLGSRDGLPGWLEVAVRTLETHPDGPVDGLAALLGEADRRRVGRCVNRRGSWPRTAARIWPDLPHAKARAAVLAAALGDSPTDLEAWLDLHTVTRLLRAWGQGVDPEDPGWRIVTQNRGGARGRLRAALAAGDPAGLAGPLTALPALYARTRHAIERYAWSWAWQQITLDFPFDAAEPVTPPCQRLPDGLAPLGEAETPTLRCWLLLVLMKDRQSHLRRWARTGGTGDRDSAWARLLSEALPEALQDPRPPGRRARTYQRLQLELALNLDDHLDALMPQLHQLAAIQGKSGLRGRFAEVLADTWRPEVPLPKGGYPAARRHLAAALETLEDPCA